MPGLSSLSWCIQHHHLEQWHLSLKLWWHTLHLSLSAQPAWPYKNNNNDNIYVLGKYSKSNFTFTEIAFLTAQSSEILYILFLAATCTCIYERMNIWISYICTGTCKWRKQELGPHIHVTNCTLSLYNMYFEWYHTVHIFSAVKIRKPWKPEIFWECWLCYDQSHWRSGNMSKPQHHRLITIAT